MAGYSYFPFQYYYTTPEVQLENTTHVPNNYFASALTPHFDVASHNSCIHIALASNFSDGFSYTSYNSENYMQQPMSHNMSTLKFNSTSNIQHAPIYSHIGNKTSSHGDEQSSRPN